LTILNLKTAPRTSFSKKILIRILLKSGTNAVYTYYPLDTVAAYIKIRFCQGECELSVNTLSDYFFDLSIQEDEQQQVKVVGTQVDHNESTVMIDFPNMQIWN
jgi:hypothetical protein